jgi:hypothetical protein
VTEPRRDRFGRYILTDPSTGEEQVWTRATTFAEALEDSYGLMKWKQRATAVGIGMRPDILALVQSHTMDDKKTLDEACEQALTVAAANSRSNLGTALHKLTERLDRGEDFAVPAAHAERMRAYHQLKLDHGIETAPPYVERITVVPKFKVAGTMDRIVRRDSETYIADLKTGEKLDYGWTKIAVQLALYSRGEGLWNAQSGTWEEMPHVNQNVGLVLHLPAEGGTAAVYEVDLNRGWEAAGVCGWVRNWRNQGRHLSEKLTA